MIQPSLVASTPFDAHSPEAHAIALLFTQTLVICAVILAVVVGLVAFCVVRFRARPGDPEPPQIEGHKRLEITWTIIPCLIVTVLFVLTAQTMAASDAPPDREPDLVVIGHQWWWEARYPSGAVAANEIHIPAGRDLIVRIESGDVIHDFWVPQLGRKIDATPGHPTTIRTHADVPGTYLGTCAEYCGAEHAWMRIRVVAEAQADFDAWESHQLEPAPAPSTQSARRGAALFRERTCIKCHAIADALDTAGARVAPDLTHLASRSTLGAGVLVNNPVNLAAWLKDPQAIKPDSHMPSLRLSDAETHDLVSYFEELP
jgi:cytochrome c oxidase subunit 2